MGYARYAAVAAVVMGITAGTASAATKCNIIGTFTDTLGSTGQFTSEKKGTVMNPNICPTPYALTVTKLTNLVVNVKGVSQTKTCGALTGKFMFQNGGCTTASGTVTIKGLGTLNDTITKTSSAFRRPPVDTSALLGDLK